MKARITFFSKFNQYNCSRLTRIPCLLQRMMAIEHELAGDRGWSSQHSLGRGLDDRRAAAFSVLKRGSSGGRPEANGSSGWEGGSPPARPHLVPSPDDELFEDA